MIIFEDLLSVQTSNTSTIPYTSSTSISTLPNIISTTPIKLDVMIKDTMYVNVVENLGAPIANPHPHNVPNNSMLSPSAHTSPSHLNMPGISSSQETEPESMDSLAECVPSTNHEKDTSGTILGKVVSTNNAVKHVSRDNIGEDVSNKDVNAIQGSENPQLTNTEIIDINSPFKLKEKSSKAIPNSIVSVLTSNNNGQDTQMLCVFCQKIIKPGNLINHMKYVHGKSTKNTDKIKKPMSNSKVKVNLFSCDFCDYETTRVINCMDLRLSMI